jgi:hypothetical protein
VLPSAGVFGPKGLNTQDAYKSLSSSPLGPRGSAVRRSRGRRPLRSPSGGSGFHPPGFEFLSLPSRVGTPGMLTGEDCSVLRGLLGELLLKGDGTAITRGR